MLHPVINGAYTELFAGLSDQVTLDQTGAWSKSTRSIHVSTVRLVADAQQIVGPWGRFFTIRTDISIAGKPKSEGGKGVAEKFWDWSTEQVQQYL